MPLVPVEQLRLYCDPMLLGCASSQDMNVLVTIIGQERAMRSLRFGLGIKDAGFNIIVSGMPGTGRTTAVKRFLDEVARSKPVPSDWCYVYNFSDPYRPNALQFPPGHARPFQEDIKTLVEGVQREIKKAFESEQYQALKEETVRSFEQQKGQLLAQINQQALEAGFFLQASAYGVLTIPVKNGKPLEEQEFLALNPTEREEYARRRATLESALAVTIRQVKNLEKGAGEALQQMDQKVADHALKDLFTDLYEKYRSLPEIDQYLDQMKADILKNLSDFRSGEEEQQQSPLPFRMADSKGASLRKYEVNILVDNSNLKGAPVVIESNPTYSNLFGRIEQEARFGALTTDFTLIRTGSLHQANGGYLVLPADDLLRSPFSWESLKRALANRQIAIEDTSEQLGFATTRSLRPEPLPLQIKVLLIGTPDLFYLLRAYDDDFSELFKVKADFDIEMERTPESMQNYAAFVCTVCQDENLKHLDSTGLAKIIEHGSRLAGNQGKLSTRFGEITDILREASYYASEEGAEFATAAHVRKAIEERHYRSNLVQERIREMINRGVVQIDVEGEKIGQINGLSVIGMGDVSFGQPSRITASVSIGSEGILDIEREARLGGAIHTKGVLILSGYFAEKFAQDKPLSMSARLVFEQSYSGVDGDSASSTEVYVLLSALSGLPIRQGIAVTGSVNQRGEVQAIGGVNEKIEGFFGVCKAKGFSGEQGVLIPHSNIENLMLKEEVIEAVQAGTFRIWSVKTIDEGIEILTGVKAGVLLEDGGFEEGSVFAGVDAHLLGLAEKLADFGKKDEEERKEEEKDEAGQDSQ